MKHSCIKLMVACAVFACATAALAMTPGSNDAFDPSADGAVRALAVQPDGKIIVGGDFTAVGRAAFSRVARINADGTTDTSFVGPEINEAVVAVALQPDGKLLISGRFNRVGGAVHNYIARLNGNGSIDDSFLGTGANGWVDAIAVQPDGRIVVGGSFTGINGKDTHKIARLQANGLVDNSFDATPGADRSVFAVAVQPDGKIIAAGEYTDYDGAPHNRIVRLNPDGSLDGSFIYGLGPNSNITTLKLQADGKILLGGYFVHYGTAAPRRVARLNADGSLDASFDCGDGADDYVNALETQPDGKILMVGAFMMVDGTIRNRIARLELNGALDPEFPDTSTTDTICAVAVQPDGKIVIGGDFTQVGGITRNHFARLNPDGSPDTTFFAYYYHPLVYSERFSAHAAVVRPDGKIMLAGDNNYTSAVDKTHHIRIVNADGSLDHVIQFISPGWEPRWVNCVALYPDGRMLVGGNFWKVEGVVRISLARLLPDYSVDPTFNANMYIDDVVNAIAIQRDGKIVIGGAFEQMAGRSIFNIVRLNDDGSIDEGFNTGGGADASVNCMLMQPDGKILIGGNFTRYHGEHHDRIVRVNPDGTTDNSFWIAGGPEGSINSIVQLPNGKVLAAGLFRRFNGMPRNNVARLNPNGSHDLTFGTTDIYDKNPSGAVLSMTMQADGKILIGGNFENYNRSGRSYVARLNADGSVDPGFSNCNYNSYIHALTVQPDGKVFVSGMPWNLQEELVMRLANPTAAQQALSVAPGGYAVTWKLGGSFPWPYQVFFEESEDGKEWRELGWGSAANGIGYQLTQLPYPIPRNHYVRATAWTGCGMMNGSTSIYRSVLWNGAPAAGPAAARDWMQYQ